MLENHRYWVPSRAETRAKWKALNEDKTTSSNKASQLETKIQDPLSSKVKIGNGENGIVEYASACKKNDTHEAQKKKKVKLSLGFTLSLKFLGCLDNKIACLETLNKACSLHLEDKPTLKSLEIQLV